MPAAYAAHDLAKALRPCLTEVLEVFLIVQRKGMTFPSLEVAMDDLEEALRLLDDLAKSGNAL